MLQRFYTCLGGWPNIDMEPSEGFRVTKHAVGGEGSPRDRRMLETPQDMGQRAQRVAALAMLLAVGSLGYFAGLERGRTMGAQRGEKECVLRDLVSRSYERFQIVEAMDEERYDAARTAAARWLNLDIVTLAALNEEEPESKRGLQAMEVL